MSVRPCYAAELGIEVAPAPIVAVRGEPATLWSAPLSTWKSRTKLRAMRVPDENGIVAMGSMVPDSLVVHRRGEVMVKGRDYVVDARWGAVAVVEGGRLADGDEVAVDYAYALRRLDAWVELADGRRELRPGVADLTVPLPPEIGPHERRIGNVFLDYHETARDAQMFWVLAQPQDAGTMSRAGRIPRTVAKLKAGGPVRIVCWGDSVTCGGDTSRPELAYPQKFKRALRAKYPNADLTLEIVAVGGSESRNWIEPQRYQHPTRQAECDWNRVVDARPDVVTIEFVNDDQFPTSETIPRYHEILRRLDSIGAEVVLITPHFTSPGWMAFEDLRDPERRQYVYDLLGLAADRNLAVADVSSRWAALWKEGLPYSTLLRNGVNHPEDRGHRLFAEELIKCFA